MKFHTQSVVRIYLDKAVDNSQNIRQVVLSNHQKQNFYGD